MFSGDIASLQHGLEIRILVTRTVALGYGALGRIIVGNTIPAFISSSLGSRGT